MRYILALLLTLLSVSSEAALPGNDCAAEGATCAITGATRRVWYGTSTKYVSKIVSNSIVCSVAAFGRDPAFGQTKRCSYSGAAIATGTGQAPTIASIAGKPLSGRIDAVSNQIIQNLHITTTSGPCIVIPDNVTNVTIRNNEIGPCGSSSQAIGDWGVFIGIGARSITVERNVIHDASTGVIGFVIVAPIVIDRNLFYNNRGPLWAGQAITLRDMTPGTGPTKITCNIVDDRIGGSLSTYGDHINVSGGTSTQANPLEIAYNRIRGKLAHPQDSESGSGMQLGDIGGHSWFDAHDNTVVLVAGIGIGTPGGSNNKIRNNRVFNDGAALSSYTGWAYAAANPSGYGCSNLTHTNNRGHSRLWAYNHTGEPGISLNEYPQACSGVDTTGSNYNDTTLTEAIFDEIYTQCN